MRDLKEPDGSLLLLVAREKSVSCLLLVESVAVGHLIVVRGTKRTCVSGRCAVIQKTKASALYLSVFFMGCDLEAQR